MPPPAPEACGALPYALLQLLSLPGQTCFLALHEVALPVRQVLVWLMLALLLSAAATVWARDNAPLPVPDSPVRATLSPFAPRLPLPPRGSLAPFLTWEAKAEVEYLHTTHVNLPSGGRGDDTALAPELSLVLALAPSRYVQSFLAIKLLGEFNRPPEESAQNDTGFELTEAFLLFPHLWDGRLALQIGRQKFTDSREWWYDEALDAVRVFYLWSHGAVSLAASRGGLVHKDLLRRQSTEEHNTVVVHTTYAADKRLRLAAYVLWRDDRTGTGESPVFFGLHADGTLLKHLYYWLESAHVRGRADSQSIRGFGVDAGGTYSPALPLAPSLTLAVAFGSGDGDPADQVDSSFRQSGLQGNKGKFNGVTGFQYYGEVLDPELSNLLLWTLGVGLKPSRRSSLDLVYHDYHQHRAAANLREATLLAPPDGRHTHLGRELDLVLGYKEIRPVDFTLVLGYFMPGRAFPPTHADNLFLRCKLEVAF